MRLGICCGPSSVEGGTLAERALKMQSVLREAGAEYFEMGVSSVTGDGFEELRDALALLEMKPEAFNSFVPGTHRITGEDVDHARVLDFCARALERCHAIGGSVVVLGSAGARKVPEGLSPERAMEQFVAFCTKLGPVAREAGMTIALEPLNRREDNLLLSVERGAQLVDQINHPHIRLLADLYHMELEGESTEAVARAGGRLAHLHLASTHRLPPGADPDDHAPYAEFFAAAKRAGYGARVSFEGKMPDFAANARTLIAALRAHLAAAA